MSIPSPAAKPPKVHVCPECSSLNLIEDFDQGETICQDCGLVLSQNLMSRGPEWRAFTKEEKDERGRVRGRSIAEIAAASLYAACRSAETPRTLKEISAASRIKKKDVARCYRLLLRELGMTMPVEDPIRCVSKIASRAEISMQTQQTAIRVLKDARKKGDVAGKDPMGLAAAALYVACVLESEKKTQKEIAEIANVTEVTVRNRYKGLKDALGLPA